MTFSARVLLAGLAATVSLFAAGSGALVARNDDERALSFYNIHTKETLTVTYMRKGQRDPDAMKKINWIMRDWRRDEATDMDPELIDMIWEVHTELGSREPIHVISGYRSPRTNENLRKGGGGQAKNSRHILGKAADIHFPDVPLKQLRYSGLVREQGGVGYYPTSGVPFVHLDTGRVRHWPRMPRYELALLFPNGKSKHVPPDGRPLTRADYAVARSRYKDLALQVAAFFDVRSGKKPTTLVADAGAAAMQPDSPSSARTLAAAPARERQVASLGSVPSPRLVPQPQQVETAQQRNPAATAAAKGWQASPRVAADQPRPAEVVANLPSATATSPNAAPPPPQAIATAGRPPTRAVPDSDRSRLASLFRLAAFSPAPKLLRAPTPVSRREPPRGYPDLTGGSLPAPKPEPAPTAAAERPAPRLAAIDPSALSSPARPDTQDAPRSISDVIEQGWSTGWAAAPEFDEEHPDEMSYRPFPVAPLLTETASPDDPVIAGLVHPKVRETLQLLDEDREPLPMRLRPGQQVAQLIWAQEFKGNAVDLSALHDHAHDDPIGQLTRRTVTTRTR